VGQPGPVKWIFQSRLFLTKSEFHLTQKQVQTKKKEKYKFKFTPSEASHISTSI